MNPQQPRCLWHQNVPVLLLAVLGAFPSLVHAAQDDIAPSPESASIQHITTYPEAWLDWMDEVRRTAPPVGYVRVFEPVQERALEMQELFRSEGIEALAPLLVEAYSQDGANLELAAAAVAVLTDSNYIQGGAGGTISNKELYGKRDGRKLADPMPDQLTANVTQLLDSILAQDSPYAKDVAAEMLLQIYSEGLGTMHGQSGNGARRIPEVPGGLTGIGVQFLGDEDPFIHAIGEWAISVFVSVENDERGGGEIWPGENPPEWWDQWEGIPEEQHLMLDYVRQVVSLQMHRRGMDLLTLSMDQMRRAEEKAEWARGQMSQEDAELLDAKLKAMKSAHQAFARVVEESPDDLAACRKAYLAWRPTVREVVMTGPDVNFDSILYLTRFSGGSHLQPGIHDPYKGRGGDIYLQDGLQPDSPRTELLGDKFKKPGFIQDFDLWYDASKIVFSRTTDDTGIMKLFEVDLAGENFQQLTFDNYHDTDPAYLPDGEIVFGSMEAQAGTMCASAMGNIGRSGASHTNIFVLEKDGDRRRITYCKDDDCYPHVLNDGRVTWMRWDYQERGVDEIFSNWVIRPDGTGSDGFFKVHIPDSEIIQAIKDARPIPHTNLLIGAGGSHRTAVEGHLVIGDLDMGINNPLAIRTMTFHNSGTSRGMGSQMRAVEEGGIPYIGGVVQKPWPLSPKSFLMSHCFDMPQSANFHLYYADVWGNKELIRREMLKEVIGGIPVRERFKPPVLPNMRDESKSYATLYVDDVYADLPGVEKGEVKYLRIAHQMFWVTKAGEKGQQYHPTANPRECFGYPGTGGTVRVFGTVPVEEDGSAYFKVPADVDLYFQALDKDFRAVQRMRTHVEFAPGEFRSCIGCHETRDNTIVNNASGTALMKDVVTPAPPPWGDTTLMNFETHIQPILDKNCVECHNAKSEHGIDFTATPDKFGFFQGYRAMFGLKQTDPTPDVIWAKIMPEKGEKRVRAPKDNEWWNTMFADVIVRKSPGPREMRMGLADKNLESIPNPPKRLGAIRHPVGKVLVEDEDHAKLLSKAEMETLMTWFDIQAPYFDVYLLGTDQPTRLIPWEPWGKIREYEVVEVDIPERQ